MMTNLACSQALTDEVLLLVYAGRVLVVVANNKVFYCCCWMLWSRREKTLLWEKRRRRMAIHSGTALSLHLKAVTLISGTRILLLLCKAYFYALPRSGGAEHKIPWDFRCGCRAPWKGENRSPLRHFRIPPSSSMHAPHYKSDVRRRMGRNTKNTYPAAVLSYRQ